MSSAEAAARGPESGDPTLKPTKPREVASVGGAGGQGAGGTGAVEGGCGDRARKQSCSLCVVINGGDMPPGGRAWQQGVQELAQA